ncbi:MAG TPA: tetratricopeptide repeat protein [Terracidiphilus sp.]|nr:tetratricopeptide repeat protein [Terracidiphilus sp.]
MSDTTIYWRIVLLAILAAAFLFRVFSGKTVRSRTFDLRRKGLDLLLAGNPSGAERCYREALSADPKLPESDQVRLLVCLGDALIDQQRYSEAEECLEKALQMGDPTGSGQGSMADLLVLEKKNPERAIEMADEALRLTTQHPLSTRFGDAWSRVNDELLQAKAWARKAQALVVMGQGSRGAPGGRSSHTHHGSIKSCLRGCGAVRTVARETDPQ